MRARTPFVALAAFVAFIGSAGAGEWPDKPVRIIFPYAAGSTGDATARLIARRLSDGSGSPSLSKTGWAQTGSLGLRRSHIPPPMATHSYGRLRRKLRSPPR
jgi:hypothetical protein